MNRWKGNVWTCLVDPGMLCGISQPGLTYSTLGKCCGQSARNVEGWAGEMAQWLRALTTLLEVLSSNPSNHMEAHNHP